MKNAIILPGISSHAKQFWFPYVKKELMKKGYEVWIPQLPDSDKPSIESQLPFILKNGKFTKNTIIIGHSSGASLILAILEKLPIKIRQAILVAGFLIRGGNRPSAVVKEEKDYDWKKMKKNTGNIVFINSDNDPWGCDDKQGKRMFDHIGGTLIVKHGEGHMGSVYYNQLYKKFPLLIKLIELTEQR